MTETMNSLSIPPQGPEQDSSARYRITEVVRKIGNAIVTFFTEPGESAWGVDPSDQPSSTADGQTEPEVTSR